MSQSAILQLSIGDDIPGRRFAADAFTGEVDLCGKAVCFHVSDAAVQAVTQAAVPIVAELELYFSCLVRKQVRFRELRGDGPTDDAAVTPTRVVPGLFASFRVVTTRECRIADVDNQPPVVTLPVKKADLFVPDWVRIDYRAGKWRGEYGFERPANPERRCP